MPISRSRAPEPVLHLPGEAATERLAAELSLWLRAGDVVALRGDLGAGKTTFARAMIRALADDPALEVPSPTFTLVQTYEDGRLPVAHFDLYRVNAPADLDELGFDDFSGAVVLVEWPERAGNRIPATALTVALAISGDGGRAATLTGGGDWPARLARNAVIGSFLAAAGWGGSARIFLQGDASARRYERLRSGQGAAVLMDAPARPDGPPVRDGRPYSRIAHLAEDVRPFIAVAAALRAAGLSAPDLYAADPDAGLLLLEDLGGAGILVDGRPDRERLRAAALVLAELHNAPRPPVLPAADAGPAYALPAYDAGAMAIEVALLPDWYFPHTGVALPPAERTAFDALWADLFRRLDGAEKSWVLRDYHSPNLLWLPERAGCRRVGLLDFQDALYGPAAYDLASLLQDARVTVPAELETEMLDAYADARHGSPNFDREAFAEAYAILAVQRATKILGIFARLAHRDGKPGYLRHIPRLHAYLARTLPHPVLSGLRVWYEGHLSFS